MSVLRDVERVCLAWFSSSTRFDGHTFANGSPIPNEFRVSSYEGQAGPVAVDASSTDNGMPASDIYEDVADSSRLSKDTRMYCPFCKHRDTRVIDSRTAEDGNAIRRRRSCNRCGRRFTTVESAVLAVVKRNGVTEPFSREKVMKGVRSACQGRHVDEDQLHKLAQRVEDALRASGSAEVPSNEVGLAILGPLRDLDEVAYLRFASVYRSFGSVDDFQKAIDELRDYHGGTIANDE